MTATHTNLLNGRVRNELPTADNVTDTFNVDCVNVWQSDMDDDPTHASLALAYAHDYDASWGIDFNYIPANTPA